MVSVSEADKFHLFFSHAPTANTLFCFDKYGQEINSPTGRIDADGSMFEIDKNWFRIKQPEMRKRSRNGIWFLQTVDNFCFFDEHDRYQAITLKYRQPHYMVVDVIWQLN